MRPCTDRRRCANRPEHDTIMPSDKLIPMWYVLHTKSRFESVVNDGLYKKSIEVFLPKIIVPSKRKDRRKLIHVPLFPGYVFVKSDLNPVHHLDILKTVGAVSSQPSLRLVCSQVQESRSCTPAGITGS